MKANGIGILGFAVVAALLAGCFDDQQCAGTSIGCGNPPRVAELETSEVNACGLSGCLATTTPFPYTVMVGQRIVFTFHRTSEFTSPEIRFRIFAGNQIPVIHPAPLDSFYAVDSNSFQLLPKDLTAAIRAGAEIPASDPRLFVFNIQILLRQQIGNLVLQETGLVTGIALNLESGQFVTNWKQPSKKDTLFGPNQKFQGIVKPDTSFEPALTGATSAHIFIPGSPYTASVDLDTRQFVMNGLPQGSFELRMFALSQNQAIGDRVPVYLVMSDPDSTLSRPFRVEGVVDSLTLFSGFP
jgi:hypothetical protein